MFCLVTLVEDVEVKDVDELITHVHQEGQHSGTTTKVIPLIMAPKICMMCDLTYTVRRQARM